MSVAFHGVEHFRWKKIKILGHPDFAFQGAWPASGGDRVRRRVYPKGRPLLTYRLLLEAAWLL